MSTAAELRALSQVGALFRLPVAAVKSLVQDTLAQLIARDDEYNVIPSNGTEPQSFIHHPLGTATVTPMHEGAQDGPLSYLRDFDSAELNNWEPTRQAKQHPAYARYIQWSKAGIEPPYINVGEAPDGTFTSINRRRVLVAKELHKHIKGWFGPRNPMTGEPLLYSEVMRAYRQAKGV